MKNKDNKIEYSHPAKKKKEKEIIVPFEAYEQKTEANLTDDDNDKTTIEAVYYPKPTNESSSEAPLKKLNSKLYHFYLVYF